MAERLTVITQLGGLAMEASQRGEDRAVAILQDAIGLLVEDSATAKALSVRRANDAERQRLKRERGKSQDVTVRHVTPRDGPKVSPDPFLTPKENTTQPARDATPALLLDALGESWPAVGRFIMRRDVSTWPGWFRQMAKEITPGSQYTPADLAQVCDDDEAMKHPIGTPFGLRIFLQKVRMERMSPPADEPSQPRRAGGGENAGAEVFAKIRALAQSSIDPRHGNSRFIPRGEVEKLGPQAVRAYETIGGAARVLTAMQDQKALGFLIREFTDAYTAAQREVA